MTTAATKSRNNIIQGKAAQRKGASAEEEVAQFLRDKCDAFAIIQNTKCTVKGNRKIYTKKQGCDIIGHIPSAESYPIPLYCEVKSISDDKLKMLPTDKSTGGGLKPSQRDFMIARQGEGCISVICWQRNQKMCFIPISKFCKYLRDHNRKSMPWSEALKHGSVLKFR